MGSSSSTWGSAGDSSNAATCHMSSQKALPLCQAPEMLAASKRGDPCCRATSRMSLNCWRCSSKYIGHKPSSAPSGGSVTAVGGTLREQGGAAGCCPSRRLMFVCARHSAMPGGPAQSAGGHGLTSTAAAASALCANLHESPKLHPLLKKSIHNFPLSSRRASRRLAKPRRGLACGGHSPLWSNSVLCANLQELPKRHPPPKKSMQSFWLSRGLAATVL